MAILLIAFSIGLSQQAPVNQEDDGKVMTLGAFNNSIGTFVEFVGRTAIAMEDWTIYASFDLEEFMREINVIRNSYKSLEKLCLENFQICPDFLQFGATDFEDTSILQRSLIEKADPQDFRFNHLPLDEIEIADLLKAKNSVVDITTNIKGVVKNGLDQLELNIVRATTPEFESWFIYHVVNQLSILEEHVKRTQDAIREALTSAHQRRLTPLILSVQQLEAEILKIQANIPPGRRLPVDHSTVSDVYRIASVTAQQLNDSHLVFTIKVPLIDAELFSLYRLTPIPRVENGQIEVMDTETPYLAINDHQDRYFPLENLGDCTELASERLLCRHQQVTYGKGSFPIIPCSLAAIRNQSSAACPFRKVEKYSLWTQLLARNSWMVALTKELSLTAVCSDERQELTINGSGILGIRSDCIVRSSDVILQGKPPSIEPPPRWAMHLYSRKSTPLATTPFRQLSTNFN